MEYTNEIPTEPGCYFCKSNHYNVSPNVVEVVNMFGNLIMITDSGPTLIEKVDSYLWLGPFTDEDLMKQETDNGNN